MMTLPRPFKGEKSFRGSARPLIGDRPSDGPGPTCPVASSYPSPGVERHPGRVTPLPFRLHLRAHLRQVAPR